MSKVEKQQLQQSELQRKLWSIASELRGNMDASEFKNYILGLIFYRYLSENLSTLNKSDDFYIEEDKLWNNLIDSIKINKFNISMLKKAINKNKLKTLFEDMDLDNSKLGKTEANRTKLISTIMLKINDIDFKYDESEIDVLGDAYEYLISNFASTSGKRGGEFYTPQQVSSLIAKLVSINKSELQNVYDPTCGSGSLLLRVGREVKVNKYYGQELNSTTYNLARMNMLLHRITKFDIRNDDTLENPKHLNIKFDAIVANPPYSQNWSADEKFLNDERFREYGKLAPKSKADFAFIQHMIYQLAFNGIMVVVLPHGILFRGSNEKFIREYLIKEKNYLDAIIGLPANIFYGTSIPTCVLIFKKEREYKDNILFIDASNDFDTIKNKNVLRDKDIDKIVKTYIERSEVKNYSHIASIKEISNNDYNLNIVRYVNNFKEDEIDIKRVLEDLKNIDNNIKVVDKELNAYLKELGLKEI